MVGFRLGIVFFETAVQDICADMLKNAHLLILVTLAFSVAPAHASPVTDAAMEVTDCQSVSGSEKRLACYDAAAADLARALGSAAPVTAADGAAPEASRISDRSSSTASTAEARSVKSGTPDRSSGRTRSSADQELDAPEWAAAPSVDPRDVDEQPDQFTDTIVRITRNSAGRHYFHTDDGAVWMQTQTEEIRPPKSLPAEAQFRRKFTGNPTIKFDVSNRSYRVRRIE